MDNYGKAAYWMDSADYDLQTAKAILEAERYLYVGFMCHQTIEKALKGIFVTRKPEDELPYIHSLVRLANLSSVSDEMSEEQLSLLSNRRAEICFRLKERLYCGQRRRSAAEGRRFR